MAEQNPDKVEFDAYEATAAAGSGIPDKKPEPRPGSDKPSTMDKHMAGVSRRKKRRRKRRLRREAEAAAAAAAAEAAKNQETEEVTTVTETTSDQSEQLDRLLQSYNHYVETGEDL